MGCGNKTKIKAKPVSVVLSISGFSCRYMNVFDVILTRTIAEYLIVKVAKIKNF